MSSDSPRASAAQTNARLVMLLEPGGRIVARNGPVGWISMESVILYYSRGLMIADKP